MPLLNDYAMKEKAMPVYEVSSVSESIWKYQLTFLGQKTEATAPSKKLAKQEAARAMLLLLGCEDDLDPSPANSEDDLNHMSALKEFCSAHNLISVSFELDQEGPHHAPTFIYTGSISDVKHSARGRSKKEAKRMCVSGILLKLKSIFTTNDSESLRKYQVNYKLDDKLNDAALAKLIDVGIVKPSTSNNELMLIKNQTFSFQNKIYPYSDTLEALTNNSSDITDTNKVLIKIFEELKFKYEIKILPSIDVKLTIIKVTSNPQWNFIGIGESLNLSQINAEEKALKFLKTMATQ